MRKSFVKNFEKLTLDSDSSTPITFGQTLWETTIVAKNPALTKKNRFEKFFKKKITIDWSSPTPITFDQTLWKNIRTHERTSFATQRMTLLSVEGIRNVFLTFDL